MTASVSEAGLFEPCPDSARLAEQLGCAQVRDAALEHTTVLNLPLRALTPGGRICAPVYPVATENDMLPCLQGLDATPPGWVLFLYNTAATSEALAGDILITAAKMQGLAGLIVKGAVRDLDAYAEIGLPVFATEVTYVSAKTAEVAAVELPMSLELPEAIVRPGDWIVADTDGCLLVPRRYARAIFTAARALDSEERRLRAALEAGGRLSELCNLHGYLNGDGPLRFED